MDIPLWFTHQLMEIWIVSTFLAIMNDATMNIHLHVFVWTCFSCVLGKYLEGVLLGYMHAFVHTFPSWDMVEAYSYPQITVLNFHGSAYLLLAAISILTSGQLPCWPSLSATSIDVASNTSDREFFPHFAPKAVEPPLQQGGCRFPQPAPLRWNYNAPELGRLWGGLCVGQKGGETALG